MANNPLISQVTLPSGQTYDIKDSQARADIVDIRRIIAGGVHYIGAVADAPAHQISDGDTTKDITVKDGTSSTKSVTAVSGDIVTQGNDEFIFDGTAWRAFGNITGLKAFAFADTGTASYTPAGTVSKPTFTGSSSTVTITATTSASGNYTPAGTVSQPTFTGSSSSVTITATDSSSGNYTPKGTVSQPTFTGTSFTSTGSVDIPTSAETTLTTTSTTLAVSKASSGTATYTPQGSVSGTAVTLNTTSVNSITAVGTLPEWSATVPTGTENLTFSWGPGTLPTKGSATTVATSVKTVTDPTFTGTGARLVAAAFDLPTSAATTLTTTSTPISVSGTATGTVSKPTFSGTKTQLSGTVTPSGTVSQPTFSGTKVSLTGTTTAAGSVSQPTFSGTAATITVNPVTTP